MSILIKEKKQENYFYLFPNFLNNKIPRTIIKILAIVVNEKPISTKEFVRSPLKIAVSA